jgi:hypothetical protein
MQVASIGRLAGSIAVAISLVVLSACGNAPAVDESVPAEAGHDMADMATDAEAAELASVRELAAGFTDIAAAQAAGYGERITPCWYHRENGGQGFHYGNPSLIDGSLSLLEPELLMYEPREDGSLEFLAIEYIVPFAEWQQSEPPVILGRDLMRNEQLELWVLHVWLGKDNPSGLYANWNPTVSCTHADESEDRA